VTGNVVINQAVAVMYVVLWKAEKLVLYVHLVGTTECLTLYTRCRKSEVEVTGFNWTLFASGGS
jgi:hypothetical protein